MPPQKRGRAPGGRNPKRPRTVPTPPPPPYPDDSDIPEHIQHKYQYGGPQAKLDLSKPPIYKLDDIFRSITDHAVGAGFKDFIEYMGSTRLRVATACSGTECPLLALEMVQRCRYSFSDLCILKARDKADSVVTARFEREI